MGMLDGLLGGIVGAGMVSVVNNIIEKHGGAVPQNREALEELPGVGRKTANVVLGNAFDTPGVTVDTHVGRLSRRLGLSAFKNPVKVERDLMGLIPRRQWSAPRCPRSVAWSPNIRPGPRRTTVWSAP